MRKTREELAAALGQLTDGDTSPDDIYHHNRDAVAQQQLEAVKAGHIPTLPHCPVPPYPGEVAHFAASFERSRMNGLFMPEM